MTGTYSAGLEGNRDELTDEMSLHHLFDTGVTYTEFKGYHVPQFRCWPHDARQMLRKNGFEGISLKNIEGIASHFREEGFSKYGTSSAKRKLFSMLKSTSGEEHLLGLTEQFFAFAFKAISTKKLDY